MEVRTPVFGKSEGRLTPELSRRPAGVLVARGLRVRTVAGGTVLAGRFGRARIVTAAESRTCNPRDTRTEGGRSASTIC